MQNVSKSSKLIIGLVLLSSLISFSGFALTLHQNTNTTELVVQNNSEASSVGAVDFTSKYPIPTKPLSAFLSFDFSSFLNVYNNTCRVKLEAQNGIFNIILNYHSTDELKLIIPSNTDKYNNIFIG